jgi:DNA-binding IclR family transcriptional regulator
MTTEFKRVPAIGKCFSILQHFSVSKHSPGISEISMQLELSKSTVFNIIIKFGISDIAEIDAA